MATGTWNQGQLEKRVTKIDLENYPTILFRDSSLTSDGIFDIVEFPNRFTAGKNLIKLRVDNSNTLVKDSKIHIEILDSNGDPIYFEPLNYLEHDGTRVISIYIFPKKTAPGIGRVYIAGRTKINLNNGNPIEFSRDFKNENYFNLPNVLWSRSIPIAPENSKNNTEIIFTRPYPKATVRERVNKFFTPINLTDVAVKRNGTGTVIIKAIPAVTPSAVSYITSPKPNEASSQLNYEGAAESKSPPGVAGLQRVMNPVVTEFVTTPADEADERLGQPVEVANAEIVTISTFSRLETIGFSLSSSMEGGSITVVNPYVEALDTTISDANGHVIPISQGNDDAAGFDASGLVQLSGSYTFVIDNILATNKANVFQSAGFKNVNENTYGAFSVTTNAFGAPNPEGTPFADYIIKDISATSNFTCSYIEPFILSETEQSQSFAEIVLSNIEPATGDVYKIQTLYKPSGQFGDFVDAGYVNVEQVEILEDITSYENIQSIGMVYNRIGYFTDLSDFNSYWETTNGSITAEVALTPAYKPDILLDGVQLIPDTGFELRENRFGYLHLKSEYHPKVYENTRYMMTLNAFADNISGSIHSKIQNSRLDIYISGSNASIQPDSEYINRYLISDINVADTIPPDLADNKALGIRVATIEATEGIQFNEIPALISFKALKQENIDVYFVVRSGVWTLSNISLKSDKQTGFSPNYTRINTRIPTEYLETPLTFKFLYYDINNNKAQAETSVYPVTFYGDNLLIGGDNNLLSGSVFIGNTVGSGIELAGVNSGYIRSIGYEGFLSASRTDQPGGFMLYTGSVLPDSPDNYNGVGIEIVQDSSSFFKFDTNDGIDIRAKKFFVGTEQTQFVSGSGGNIEISSSNFHLQPDGGLIIGGDTVINAELSANALFVPAGTTAGGINNRAYMASDGNAKFVGNGAGDYIVDFSVAGATISGFEISSSEIKDVNENLRLKSSGQITGSNVQFTGGDIAGWDIDENSISKIVGDDRLFITTDAKDKISVDNHGSAPVISMYNTSQYLKVNIGNIYKNSANTGLAVFDNWNTNSKIFETSVNTGSGALTAQIAGWNFNTSKLYNTGVHLSASYGLKVFDGTDDGRDFIEIKYKASDDWGLLGKSNNVEIFKLGDTNHIAGWKFDNSKIISNLGVNSEANPGIVFKSEGTIETDPFISGLTANATGWQIRSDGRAEFENAVIRGTLSTAVFEKDTISVVGGQVMVANAAKIDNISPRFTTYPYVTGSAGERINYSGEELPAPSFTQSFTTGGTYHNTLANVVHDSDLWFKITNAGANTQHWAPAFSIVTEPDKIYRLTYYQDKGNQTNATQVRIHRQDVAGGTNSIGEPNYRAASMSFNGAAFRPGSQYNSVEGFNYAYIKGDTEGARWTLYFINGNSAAGKYGYIRDIHMMEASQSITVDNAGGFVNGEYLVAKSTDQGPDGRAGFVREYMQVHSASLGLSETPASGTFDFSSATINTSTNVFITASKTYTFTGVSSTTADQVANNQYYFIVGSTKAESVMNLKDKIVEEVLDMFANTTGSLGDKLYLQSVGVGTDGNAYGIQSGSTQVTLGGAIARTKPTLTVERNMDAMVSGNERGYFIDRIKDGQSLASQGAEDTGYILLNAQPTDDNTPYIDIVERQNTNVGSQQHTGDDANSVFGEVTTLARLGDLSGISDNNFSDAVTGYGLYTQNGYFKGKIEVASLPEAPPSDNLIVHIPFDDKALSASGERIFMDFVDGGVNGLGGKLHENGNYNASKGAHVTVNSSSAILGGAGDGDGGNDVHGKLEYLNCNFGDTLTIAAWIKRRGIVTDIIFTFDGDEPDKHPDTGATLSNGPDGVAGTSGPDLYFNAGQVMWNTGDGNRNHFETSLGSGVDLVAIDLFPQNEWRHFAIVNDKASLTASLYVNGVKKGEAQYRNTTVTNDALSIFGYVAGNNSYNFDGELDEFRIYTGSLNTKQIEALYLQPNAGVGSTKIEGDQITTGKIKSNNYGASAGSIFDLDDGTFKLGGSDSAHTKLSWDGANLAVKGQITIEAGSTDNSGIADAAQAAADAAQATANDNALTAFNQWVTASLDQLRTTGDYGGGTVSDDRGMFTTPSYWGNKPLVQIFDTGPISDGWTQNTTLAGAGTASHDLYTFTSTETISGSIRIHARDAEGNVKLVVNSGSAYQTIEMTLNDGATSLHPHVGTAPIFVNQIGTTRSGSNWVLSANITNFSDFSGGSQTGEETDAIWEFRIPIQSGSNTIRFYAVASDGGSVRRISVFKDGTIGQTGIDTAQATGELGVANAALAQNAIDEMESQLVLTNTSMDISSSGQSPDFGLATFGTTTEFFDGTSAQNTKLRLNQSGVRAFGDDANTYADITSAGLDIVEDSVNVANFGSDVRVGPHATNKSAFRVDSSGNVTLGTSNTTNVTIKADGTVTITGSIEIGAGSSTEVDFGAGAVASASIGTNLYQHGPLQEHSRSLGAVSDSQLPNASWNAAADNAIEYVVGPFGNQELAITCYPDSANNGDGGFFSEFIDIDPTCGYMFTIYMKRTTHATLGSAYFGTHAGPDTRDLLYANVSSVTGQPTEPTASNPYFFSGDVAPQGETTADSLDRWFLHIGYVYPSGSAVVANRTGSCYDMTTGLKATYTSNKGTSFKWHTGATQTRIRAYHYYNTSGDGNTKYQEIARPAIYKMDGTEPTIQQLLGHEPAANALVNAAAASSSAGTAISNAQTAQDAIDLMETRVVIDNNGMALKAKNDSGNAALNGQTIADFGTTTTFFDGSVSENEKLILNASGVKSLLDSNNYSFVYNQGFQVVSASAQVAQFGADTIVGKVGAGLSNVQITGGNVKLRTNTTTKLELNSAGAISASGFAIDATGGLTASNADFDGFAIARSLRQKTVTITQANMHQYCMMLHIKEPSGITHNDVTLSHMETKTTKLVLDGSLGGDIVSHVIIDVDLETDNASEAGQNGGILFANGQGTVPDNNYQLDRSGVSGWIDGLYTTTPSTQQYSAWQHRFGGIREIIAPSTSGGQKVPVTVEVATGRTVDFVIPTGTSAENSPFGSVLKSNLEHAGQLSFGTRAV